MLIPNFTEFLKKLYELTGGQLQVIDRYEVGRDLGLGKEQSDDLVTELSETGMIGKTTEGR